MKPVVSEEEFNEWLRHPMTEALRNTLELRRDALRKQWEAGTFTDYEKDATILVNVGNMGTCKGYAFVVDFTYEDYIQELDNGKY